MSNILTIAQVSDLHISPVEEPFRGIDVHQNFINVLNILATQSLDLVVFSGDLAALDGEIESYHWIKQKLSDFPHPYIVMAGNHDSISNLQEVFQLPKMYVNDGSLYFSVTIKNKQLIFLDSSLYFLSLKQLTWLKTQLTEQEALLFIHHPPILCGCQFMDTGYPLKNIDEVWPILSALPQINHLFCGHYHTDKTIKKDGKYIHIAPSTAMQIDTNTKEFNIEHTIPGWRIIEWGDTEIFHQVHYLQSVEPN